ncbi:hypothetical protein Poly21_08630 [Allorhodopirellula heiligendammensis]|uniref:Sulfatase N-terminal domain-containing protein n=1 Tax=Allorhodopirellula heiligendammensis TaxID=2714739 RepID=A0A5C6C3T9_9BACT|nr:hypothetical protein Poly21_08630 [Allorhodopirellula heiligendammensis]
MNPAGSIAQASLSFLFAFLLAGTGLAAEKPNIVLLHIDAWAWNGSRIAMDDSMPNSRTPVLQMPNVERLAREGMKFTNACICATLRPANSECLTSLLNDITLRYKSTCDRGLTGRSVTRLSQAPRAGLETSLNTR